MWKEKKCPGKCPSRVYWHDSAHAFRKYFARYQRFLFMASSIHFQWLSWWLLLAMYVQKYICWLNFVLWNLCSLLPVQVLNAYEHSLYCCH